MAEYSMKDIKLRIKSIENTKQITKAMELVASSKLRKAKERVERSRPFFRQLQEVIIDIAGNDIEKKSPYLCKREVKKSCYIVIAGDRGLAGGYNNNIFNLTESNTAGKNTVFLPIGKKTLEYYSNKGMEIITDVYDSIESISVGRCFEIAGLVSEGFLKNEFDEVNIVYTNFVNVLSQIPTVMKMLPLDESMYTQDENGEGRKKNFILYEPGSAAVFDAIIPDYIAGVLWGAACESKVSEFAARRTAMEAATKNAGEMIDDLSLKYNRARQGAITQEITEIVAGSEV